MAEGKNPLTPVIEAVQQHLGGFKPENALDFMGFFASMPNMFEELAASMGRALDTLAEQSPVDSAVVEDGREMVALLNGLRDKSAEVNGTFRRKHEVEINRIESPRHGERQFDVAANQD